MKCEQNWFLPLSDLAHENFLQNCPCTLPFWRSIWKLQEEGTKRWKVPDSWITIWNTAPLPSHSGLWCAWKIYFYYFKPVRVWNYVQKSAYPNICNLICYELMWKYFDFTLNLESDILVTECLMAWCWLRYNLKLYLRFEECTSLFSSKKTNRPSISW